jgi:hypothetical protein
MTKGALPNLQLAASEAFAILLKFERVDLDSSMIIPLLLSLLQKTSDSCGSHFIVSLASLLTQVQLPFWVDAIRRVLVTSSLIDSTTLGIEPTQDVKKTCLDVLTYVVHKISEQTVLITEHLDDVVSALCRATETGSVQLQEAAFPILQKIIELFRNCLTDDGNRVLDLYDSQFASVVPLEISGGFLSTYLTFNTDNMAKDPENRSAILIVYFRSLDSYQQRSTAFYALASHLCSIGHRYNQIRPLIEPFLLTLMSIFSNVVLQARALRKPGVDWRTMNELRKFAAKFYEEMFPAFVWLQSRSQVMVRTDLLVAFFVIELTLSKEDWMVSAGFEALMVALDLGGR